VGFDFLRRLLKDPSELSILGDGTQSKSYIHVTDVVDAVLVAHRRSTKPVEVFNVATGDYITVREIAELACECLGLGAGKTRLTFGTGNRGWKGDVPVVRLATDRMRGLGWRCRRNTREALKASLTEMLPDLRAGRA
jgi:UDP-glucose 4-epimerase